MGNRISESMSKTKRRKQSKQKYNAEQTDEIHGVDESLIQKYIDPNDDENFPPNKEHDYWQTSTGFFNTINPTESLIMSQNNHTVSQKDGINSQWQPSTQVLNNHQNKSKTNSSAKNSLQRNRQHEMNQHANSIVHDDLLKKSHLIRQTQQIPTVKKPLNARMSWHESSFTLNDATMQIGNSKFNSRNRSELRSKAMSTTHADGISTVPKPIYVAIDHGATVAERSQLESLKRTQKSQVKSHADTFNRKKVNGRMDQNTNQHHHSPVLRKALKKEKGQKLDRHQSTKINHELSLNSPYEEVLKQNESITTGFDNRQKTGQPFPPSSKTETEQNSKLAQVLSTARFVEKNKKRAKDSSTSEADTPVRHENNGFRNRQETGVREDTPKTKTKLSSQTASRPKQSTVSVNPMNISRTRV